MLNHVEKNRIETKKYGSWRTVGILCHQLRGRIDPHCLKKSLGLGNPDFVPQKTVSTKRMILLGQKILGKKNSILEDGHFFLALFHPISRSSSQQSVRLLEPSITEHPFETLRYLFNNPRKLQHTPRAHPRQSPVRQL